MRFFLSRARTAQVVSKAIMTACALAGCSGPSTSNPGQNGSGAAGVGGASVAGGSAQGAASPGTGGATDSSTAGGPSGNAGGPSANPSCPADDGTAPPLGDAGLPALPNLATTYQGTFSKPPQQVDTGQTTDAPLLGNGDLGVAVLGSIDAMTFVLSKNEFWSLQGAVKAMARLSLSIPSMAGASYSMTEKIATGQVTGSFVQGGQSVSTTSWVQATDTKNNQLFTEIANAGASALQVSVTLAPGHKNSNPSKSGAMADVLYDDVQADSGDMVGGQPTRKVRVAVRAIGAAGTATNGTLTFSVPTGQKVVLATSVMSNLDSAMYTTEGVASLAALDAAKVDALAKTHLSWWDSFYRKSFIEIQDKNSGIL